MANTCPVTNKSSSTAGGYSNRVRATQYNPTGKRRQDVNFQKKRIYVPEIDETITLNISTEGLRVIQKKGAYRALKEADIIEE